MSKSLYRAVDAHVRWPEMEHRVGAMWREREVFRRSLEDRSGGPEWVFYEGPPTANGKPGIHHVEPRTFKDVFCRYQTMHGRYVFRKGGWDCHGLPVEVEVEKELGIKHKRQIEDEVGIEEFVRRCRESVQRYVGDFEALTDRIAYWVDMDDAYWTMSPTYIESVWWLLKQIWDKGLLEEDFKVVPYCPRCETSLSAHEQHQPGAYKQVVDPSIFVRFPLEDTPATALLVWTTTPWTLLANMAAAVGPEIDYVRIPDPGRDGHYLILSAERASALVGERAEVVEHMPGRDLIGRRYTPPFGFVASGPTGHTVRAGDFVATEEGTGIVHLAPYGVDDMTLARRDGLPVVQMIDPSGDVVPEGGEFAGLWVKDADRKIVADLERRDLLWRSERHEHSYPHCWRCDTPLLYYPRKDWYIRTSQVRSELLAANEDTNWQPSTVKHGRFGDWLANNVDWSLSRDRYWGTPLPIWRCGDDHVTCVGSIAELSELAGRELSGMDPHRPYVDEVTLQCPQCGREARRVRSTIDAWFDSGAMPFAQWHYPFENEDVLERRFPADFISEAIDQTRGWFYSLLAIATLVRGQNAYRNVVCLGLLVDAEGRKMSKSLGNVIDPWTVLEVQGADVLRWYLLTSGNPWAPRRISVEIIEEVQRKYLLTLWNTYSFWVTYASLEDFRPPDRIPQADELSVMDRWVLAELDDTTREVTEALDELDATRGGRRLDRFVDDLSNWYVRRCRRRFWRSAAETDTRVAFAVLWECLVSIAKLSAPFTPYIADEIFTNLTGPGGGPDSVHLADWPERVAGRADDDLRRRMAMVRRLVGLGRSARTDARVRVRQPLARAMVVLPSAQTRDLEGLERLVADELNVKDIEIARGLEELVTYTVKPNFKALGPRLGARVRGVASALEGTDAAGLVTALERDGSVVLEVGDDEVALGPDDLDVRVEGRPGFALAREGPYGVALDVELTPALLAEGTAREVVRAVQDLRKSAGLAVEDRIDLWLVPSGEEARAALEAHGDLVASEVLATSVSTRERLPDDTVRSRVTVPTGTVTVAVRRSA